MGQQGCLGAVVLPLALALSACSATAGTDNTRTSHCPSGAPTCDDVGSGGSGADNTVDNGGGTGGLGSGGSDVGTGG